ncbi:MAG: hypothetical protein LBH09_03700 [Peptococcaceae bacterium]|jgi:hypothetical protein|nr:hypothetical protein [Peptococcaceae bacterium]
MAEWLGAVLDRFGISPAAYTLTLWIIEIAIGGYIGWRIGMREKREKDAKDPKKKKK